MAKPKPRNRAQVSGGGRSGGGARRGKSPKQSDPPVPTMGVEAAIGLLTAEYGPFPQEPRLDPIHELTFTILSQHTSDTNSERAFGRLMQRFGSLESVAEAPVGDIEAAISVGGLAKVKAPRIKAVLTRVLELNGSLDLSFLAEMPLAEAKAWLRQLPGIGPKSAGIILSFSLGMPAMAIDTHIYRVCQRLGLIGPKVSADQAHDLLEAAVAPEQVYPFHVAFINHGRQVCKAQRPRCADCVVSHGCPARRQFLPSAADAIEAPATESGSRSSVRSRSRATPTTLVPHTYPETQ